MIKKVKIRLMYITVCFLIILVGVYILLSSFNENIMYYYTPSQVHKMKRDKKVRVGGIVKKNSVIRNGEYVFFDVEDTDGTTLKAEYKGNLTVIFREGQGIILTGVLRDEVFAAEELYTKHDETYKPPARK